MRNITLLIITLVTSGCANKNYQKPAVASDITGFYSYTHSIIGAVSVQAIQLNSDGSGFSCNYSIGSTAVNRTPMKHIGDNVWASASFGTAAIKKNPDGSVSWSTFSTYFPEKIENTNCR